MSNPIKELSDDDLEAVHQNIRRDAASDLDIARDVERKLGRSIARTDNAARMMVHRYRSSKQFKSWLGRYNSQWVELEKAVRLQQERYKVLMRVFEDASRDGASGALGTVSRALMARLLTIAAEMSDDDLKTAASRGGFLTKVISAQQQSDRLAGETAAKAACDVAADEKLSAEQRQSKIRELFGLPTSGGG